MLDSAFKNKKLMLSAPLSVYFVLSGSDVARKLKEGTLGSSVDPNTQNYATVWVTIIIIIIISNLSNDRSKASSKTIPPHSAI